MWKRTRKFFRKHGWMGAAVSWVIHGFNFYLYGGVVLAAVIAWAFTTWSWYWTTLQWAGVAIAFLGAYFVLAVGCVLFGLGASYFSRRHGPGPITASLEDGPLTWLGFSIMGSTHQPVVHITFTGINSSQHEVLLKEANITSAVDGRRLALDVVAVNETGKNEVTPISLVNSIPPRARVELVARFGGLEAEKFLETWRQFFLNVTTDAGIFRRPYNEETIMIFFPGMVGPRVTKKAPTS